MASRPSLDASAPQNPPQSADETTLSFEAALARLESVVLKLERGELSLEESLASYEQGVRLVALARGKLHGLQGRLEELLADGTTRALEKKKNSDGSDTGASS
jgi:exodeoxyribonuclease VII small subunit